MQCTQTTLKTILLLAACATLLLLPLLVRPYRIEGNSMHPTLKDRRVVMVETISPLFRSFSRGEIIVLQNPHKPGKETDIKRIIGLPGETVHVLGDRVVISRNCAASGAPLAPQFTPLLPDDGPCQKTFAAYTEIGRGDNGTPFDMFLGPVDYFVLGDNREESLDSRRFGAVQPENIIGRVLFSL